MTDPNSTRKGHRHGDVFGRGSGNMYIHVQRESGLAHRNLVLRPWQVQALRLVASRWFAVIATVAVASWIYFAVQATRVPFLVRRVTHLEGDSAKIDTLRTTLERLQARYDQVQTMMSAAAKTPPASTTTPGKSAAAAGKAARPDSTH